MRQGAYLQICRGRTRVPEQERGHRAKSEIAVAAHCRERKGPALVHAHVTRPYSHSLSDDEKLYKPTEFREGEAQRDPLPKFGLFLVREGILDEAEVEHLEAEVDREILDATDRALEAELPS